jgi:cation:H+ antiporter
VLLDAASGIGGLILLILAADRLVVSAVRVSRALGVSTILIGAVIVGFGTSAPEFLVSGLAASEGRLDLAVSNIVSSNTSNVTLVLGAAAVLATIVSQRRVIRREGALMFAAVVVLAAVLANGYLSFVEGVILWLLMIGAVYLLVRWAGAGAGVGLFAAREGPAEFDTDEPSEDSSERNEEDNGDDGEDALDRSWRREVGRELIVGLVALIVTLVAADLLLDGAVGLGEEFGLSAAFIGFLTGVGTSLPELSAALAGARRRQSDLVLGNVLGSNIFNSLGVAGTAAIVGPGALTEVDVPIIALMLAACLLAGVFAYSGRERISRIEGLALLAFFFAYAALIF